MYITYIFVTKKNKRCAVADAEEEEEEEENAKKKVPIRT